MTNHNAQPAQQSTLLGPRTMLLPHPSERTMLLHLREHFARCGCDRTETHTRRGTTRIECACCGETLITLARMTT